MLWVSKLCMWVCGVVQCGVGCALLLPRADKSVILQRHFTGQRLTIVCLRAVGVDQVSS